MSEIAEHVAQPQAFASSEAEFVRPDFDFESEFAQFRNWWARDRRIVGNAFSLLLYLVTHRRTYRITQSRAQNDLGLGKDAFRSARRKLEQAGFLRVEELRHPAGTVDSGGNSIAGHRRVLIVLLDPDQPNDAATTSEAFPPPLFGDDEASWSENGPETLHFAPVPGVRNPDLGDLSSEADPPTVLPPLKEHQDQEDQSSSSALELAARALHPQHSIEALARWLATHAPTVAVEDVDLLGASVDVIHASVRPVGNPIAYVGRSIVREPDRWTPIDPGSEESRAAAPGPRRLGNRRPPTVAECGAGGHRFVGQFREICGTCGDERPNWREDRDRDPA